MEKFHISPQSIIAGVDVHKYSHTAVAQDCWGKEIGRFEFSNDTLKEYADWLLSLGKKENILVALEDANGYGVHLVDYLSQQGLALRYVPAILTERARKASTQRRKSDYLDAKRVGKVILTKYEETLPVKESIADRDELTTGQTMDMLLAERRDLVKGKTAVKNQLHALLHRYYGDHYFDSFPKAFHKHAVAFYLEDLEYAIENKGKPVAKLILAQSILRRLKRLIMIEEQILSITKEMERAGKSSPQIMALYSLLHGCGMMTASTIMSQIITIKRFGSKAKFAMYAGVAPTERSSGSRDRLYTNPFGNRLLNRAIHTIALSQISCKGDKRGKEYYARKLEEGKTKLWSMRCLKRQLANRIFQILKQIEHQPEAS